MEMSHWNSRWTSRGRTEEIAQVLVLLLRWLVIVLVDHWIG
jgi:hypothetical protein